MGPNGTNGSTKPRGVLCRRAQLMRWTGWSETDIAYLVGEKRLKAAPLRKNGKLRYNVESAQGILDQTR